MPTTRPKATRADVDEAIRQIRAYYRQGKASLKELPGRGGYDVGAIVTQARRLREQEPGNHWSDTKLRKARQLARPKDGYSAPQLNDLCRLLRAHRPHFGVAHLGVLVTVRWTDGRKALQKKCIVNDWSKTELEAQIKLRFGSRRQGGRHRRVATDPGQLLVQIDEAADSFLRWYKVAAGEDEEGSEEPCALDALSDSVRRRVLAVKSAMDDLRKAVRRQLRVARESKRKGANR